MDKNILKVCKKALFSHKIICFPTETVMGLGVLYNDEDAYNLLNKVKQRREDKPYTLMLGNKDDIDKYAYVDNRIKNVIDSFLPGSLTLLLKAKENVPSYVTHNTGIIGVRVPSNTEALELLKYIEVPLLVPSANKSGEKPALNDKEAYEIFKDEVEVIVPGCSTSGTPSTIIDFTKEKPVLIREGNLSFEEVMKIYER